MAGIRELGEVISYTAADGLTLDDSGYLLQAVGDGTEEVELYDGTGPLVGANFVSTEDYRGEVNEPRSGEVDVVAESAAFPLVCADGEYTLGQDVYAAADGTVTTDDGGGANRRVGRVARYADTTTEEDEKVSVKFDTN